MEQLQLHLQNVFAQDDESQTGIEQSLGQKNLGSGESINFNCADNTLEGSPSSLSLCQSAKKEPPEESATLFVCKEVVGNQEIIPFFFEFIITEPSGVSSQVPGGPIGDPDPDCPPGSNQPGEVVPGEYEIREIDSSLFPRPDSIEVGGDCTQDSYQSANSHCRDTRR